MSQMFQEVNARDAFETVSKELERRGFRTNVITIRSLIEVTIHIPEGAEVFHGGFRHVIKYNNITIDFDRTLFNFSIIIKDGNSNIAYDFEALPYYNEDGRYLKVFARAGKATIYDLGKVINVLLADYARRKKHN